MDRRYLLAIPLLATGLLVAAVLSGTVAMPGPSVAISAVAIEHPVPIAGSMPLAVTSEVVSHQEGPGDGMEQSEQPLVPAPSPGNLRGGPTYDEHASDIAGRSPVDSPYLAVPYRTQFDGTADAGGNCGPASLGMVMAYFGVNSSTAAIRQDVNRSMGDWSIGNGSSWDSLAYAAGQRGFSVIGLRQGKGYHRWTIDELEAQVQKGLPSILLVRYRMLPGHEKSAFAGNHYIVFLGLTADGDVLYNDPAFQGNSFGAYRTMSTAQLMRAWGNANPDSLYSAMAVQPKNASSSLRPAS